MVLSAQGDARKVFECRFLTISPHADGFKMVWVRGRGKADQASTSSNVI
tara:strand:+ start:1057 stop:1203 length:147 start_codon:yes stop_codon:yes gene_type:complete